MHIAVTNFRSTVSWSISIPGRNWRDSGKRRRRPWWPWSRCPNRILLWL